MPEVTRPGTHMLKCALSVAMAATLTGCSSARFASQDLSATPARSASAPAPAAGQRSALGRPAPAIRDDQWNGSPSRIAEGATRPAPQGLTTAPVPQYGPRLAASPPPQAIAPAYPRPTDDLHAPSAATLPRGTIMVQPGDTLYGLSRRHGVSISALMDLNRLQSLTLQPGQILRLPAQSRPRA